MAQATKSTLAQLTFYVRTILGENYAEKWKDPMLYVWINDAAAKVAEYADFYWMEHEDTISATPGTSVYDFAFDVKKVIRVQDANGNEYSPVSFDDYGRQGSSTDGLYTYFGGQLKINVSTPTTLTVSYYRYPPYLTSPDEHTIVPKSFERTIFFYVCARCKEDEGELKMAEKYDSNFDLSCKNRIIADSTTLAKHQIGMRPMPLYQ